MDVTVSVIVPAWKAEHTLMRCAESVLSQKADVELIIIDDGSPDHTPQIADRIAEDDHRVRVHHATHGGRCIARNHGIGMARGEWIVFVDADDIVPTDALSTLLRNAGHADIVWGNYDDDRGTGPRCSGDSGILDVPTANRLTANIEAIDTMPSGFAFDTWNTRTVTGKAYRRWLLAGPRGVRFVPGLRFGEDCLFNLEATARSRTMRYIDLPVYRHQHRLSQTVATFHTGDFDSVVLLARNVMRLNPDALLVHEEDLRAFVAREWLNTFARGARYTPLSGMRDVCASARHSLVPYIDDSLSYYRSRNRIRLMYNMLRTQLVRQGWWGAAFMLQRIAGHSLRRRQVSASYAA